MLEVQKYLLSGKTIEDLSNEYGIKSTYHPTEKIVILNYDQLESPKSEQIVRECRSLTLELNTWKVVARSFFRFFNWGEMLQEAESFDWATCEASTKEDGSLITLFWYNGNWHIQTKGSFGQGECGFSGKSWQELFFELIPLDLIERYCQKDRSFIFEFCSIHNKIVRQYKTPRLYLLSQFYNDDGLEICQSISDTVAKKLQSERPEFYNFTSIDEAINFINIRSKNDATFEGLVLCDIHGNRWKVKSALYLSLHKMRGEGDNLFNPKYLLPFVLAGEGDELLVYFEEVKDTFYEMKNRVDSEYETLVQLWHEAKNIESQRDFAQFIVPKTKFSSLLFRARKGEGTIRDLWLKSDKLILHILYGK